MKTCNTFRVVGNKSCVLHMCRESLGKEGSTFFAFFDPSLNIWCLQSQDEVKYTDVNFCPFCAAELKHPGSSEEKEYARATEQYLDANVYTITRGGAQFHLESLPWINGLFSSLPLMMETNWGIWTVELDSENGNWKVKEDFFEWKRLSHLQLP